MEKSTKTPTIKKPVTKKAVKKSVDTIKSKIPKKPTKVYETNVKPTSVGFTNIKRVALAEDILSADINVYNLDKQNDLVELSSRGNKGSLAVAKELSNLKYRLENVYISDLCSSLYTMLSTLSATNLNARFKNVQTTKHNGVRFTIDRQDLLHIAMDSITTPAGNAKAGCYGVKKYVKSVLDGILDNKKTIPMLVISLNDYKLPNGEVKDLIVKVPPLIIHSIVQSRTDDKEYFELELNGLVYPTQLSNGKFKVASSYYHVPNNLSVLLSLGEDLFEKSSEYKDTNKKISFEIARRFIDLIQMAYSLEHNLPDTQKIVKDNVIHLKVWGDTLYSLFPKAFRTKNYIRRSEFIFAAELSSLYFHLAINHLKKSKQYKANKYLVTPFKDEFCLFDSSDDFCIFQGILD